MTKTIALQVWVLELTSVTVRETELVPTSLQENWD